MSCSQRRTRPATQVRPFRVTGLRRRLAFPSPPVRMQAGRSSALGSLALPNTTQAAGSLPRNGQPLRAPFKPARQTSGTTEVRQYAAAKRQAPTPGHHHFWQPCELSRAMLPMAGKSRRPAGAWIPHYLVARLRWKTGWGKPISSRLMALTVTTCFGIKAHAVGRGSRPTWLPMDIVQRGQGARAGGLP